MDQAKCGQLIRKLRTERGLTQLQLADRLGVSDKAVSKWERGLGCPDVSLLGDLSKAFGVKIETLLGGDLSPNRTDGGNMKRLQFFVCPVCGSILTSTGQSEVSCCGRTLVPLKATPVDDAHKPTVEMTDDEYYITVPHEMTKEHYLRFAAYLSYDRVLMVRMYPEQDAAIRMPVMRGGRLYLCCSRHGLMEARV